MYPRYIINNSPICSGLWKGVRFLRIDSFSKATRVGNSYVESLLPYVDEDLVNSFIEQGEWKEIREEEAALL